MKPSLRANFDVGVLFYNRARQTLNCVQSFLHEDIQPNIVILDQGSASTERKLLHEGLSGYPNIRFVVLTENIGVAAGRNRLCEVCSAEWIVFVDNDMALNTQGGVSLINSVIEHADGIDAFSPRILNVHENRFADRLQLKGRNGRLEIAPIGPAVVTTNTFVGGGVVLRRSFLFNEPYDERYFIGFEDFELALRAFAGRCGSLLSTV
jgi:GT2 family glycosyltransferase